MEILREQERVKKQQEEEMERRKLEKEERIKKILEERNSKNEKKRRAIKQASANVAKRSYKGLFTTEIMSNAAFER